MSQLTSILFAPFYFFFGEDGIFASSTNTRRQQDNQALYLGLPAIVFAVLGVLLLFVGEFSAGKPLIRRYEDRVEEIRKSRTDLTSKLNQELKMARATQSPSESVAEVSSLRDQMLEELSSEQILHNKLNSLAPDEPKHLYNLAMTYMTKSDLATLSSSEDKAKLAEALKNQGLSIMKRIAPLENPGYVKAHLYLAKNALSSNALTANEGLGNIRLATVHLDNALIREQDDKSALILKFRIAQKLRQTAEAKVYLEKLFEADPFFYRELCQLNSQLDLSNENLGVLNSAQVRLSSKLDNIPGPSDLRTSHLTYLVDCLHRLGKLDNADRRVRDEMQEFPDDEGTQQWGNRLLSVGQQIRYQQNGPINKNNMDELVGYLREGHRLDPNNEKILDYIVNLRRIDFPGLAEISKEIYQPGPNAPPSVENALGTIALKNKDYLQAVKQFTVANKKAPNNAEYLNNLSFVYLTRPDPDPWEALKLVDKAIRSVRSGAITDRFLSNFYDTKGRALMALGKIAADKGDEDLANSQYAAGVAKLLAALSDRPIDAHNGIQDQLKIVKAVVECYQALGQPELVKVWSERMQELEAKQVAEADKNE